MNTIQPIPYDIETRPAQARAIDWVKKFNPAPPPSPPGDFDPKSVKLGNLKDADKVRVKIEKAEVDHELLKTNYGAIYEQQCVDHVEKALSKAALEPRTAEILTIQIGDMETDKIEILTGSEDVILRAFWDHFESNREAVFINWTGTSSNDNWDLNMLFRRSLANRIYVPHEGYPTSHGKATQRWQDMAPKFLAFERWPASSSLEKAAHEFGIPCPDCAPVTGATFWKYWTGVATDDDGAKGMTKPKQMKAALKYAETDVRVLKELYLLLNSF